MNAAGGRATATDERRSTRGDRPGRASAERTYRLGAELGLLALSLGTLAGFIRLFDGFEFVGRSLVPVVAAWALALGLRRGGLRTVTATVLHLGIGVLGLSWWFAPSTLAVVLPTTSTAELLRDLVDQAFGSFDQMVAPVPVEDGFLVVIVAVLWVFAAFADAAAFRYRAPVQAAVPYVAAFVAVGVLARESGRTTAAIWFLAGLGAYAVGQRALVGLDERWVRGKEALGARALAIGAVAAVVVSAVIGVLAGPSLPGGTDPVLDLRDLGRGDGPRTVVSPFVGIRSLLGERSDEVMFSVESAEPAYWRLTSLEEYDPTREIWVSRGTYRRVDDDLPGSIDASVPTRQLDQRYRIDGLGGVWLPGAYVPDRIEIDAEVSYADRSSSIILRDDRSGALEYRLRSRLPEFSSLGPAGPVEDDLEGQYVQAPGLSPEVEATLAAVLSGPGTDHERLLQLQNWFREEFDYDESVDYSNEPDAVAAFLGQRRGFCQQFSSTFALAARAAGMPARVAVGFTTGESVGTDAEGTSTYVVRGRYAHAWPEVHFAGVGWVPYEPTPQRGDPQAQGHTGVPPQQAAGAPTIETTTTTAPTTTTEAQEPTTPTTSPDDLRSTDDPDTASDQDEQRSPSTTPVLAVLALLAVLGGALGARWWSMRRSTMRHRADQDLAVADAWADALAALALLGLRAAAGETPLEFARRVEAGHDVVLSPLAVAETRRRFSAGRVDERGAALAEAAAAAVVAKVREETTRRQRARALVTR